MSQTFLGCNQAAVELTMSRDWRRPGDGRPRKIGVYLAGRHAQDPGTPSALTFAMRKSGELDPEWESPYDTLCGFQMPTVPTSVDRDSPGTSGMEDLLQCVDFVPWSFDPCLDEPNPFDGLYHDGRAGGPAMDSSGAGDGAGGVTSCEMPPEPIVECRQ